MLLMDDACVIHETTPIQPQGRDGVRDTLVLTYREGDFRRPRCRRPEDRAGCAWLVGARARAPVSRRRRHAMSARRSRFRGRERVVGECQIRPQARGDAAGVVGESQELGGPLTGHADRLRE